MGWASRSGRAITNPDHPRAFAVCDACGFWYNHHRLKWKQEWQGVQIARLNLLVCETCWDKPNPQLKTRLMPPDPVPIRNPRVEPWLSPGFFDRTIGTEPPPGSSTIPPLQDLNQVSTEGDQPLEIEP